MLPILFRRLLHSFPSAASVSFFPTCDTSIYRCMSKKERNKTHLGKYVCVCVFLRVQGEEKKRRGLRHNTRCTHSEAVVCAVLLFSFAMVCHSPFFFLLFGRFLSCTTTRQRNQVSICTTRLALFPLSVLLAESHIISCASAHATSQMPREVVSRVRKKAEPKKKIETNGGNKRRWAGNTRTRS